MLPDFSQTEHSLMVRCKSPHFSGGTRFARCTVKGLSTLITLRLMKALRAALLFVDRESQQTEQECPMH